MAIALSTKMDMTTADGALKQHYVPLRVKNMVYKDRPLLGTLPKMTRFGGRNLPIPVQFGTPAGRGTTIAQAQASLAASLVDEFLITRKSNYGVARIQREAMKASEGDVNAFMRMAVTEIDGILQTLSNDVAVDLYGDGTGIRGVIGSRTDVANSVITLATISDIVNFEVGMILEARVTSTGVLRVSPASATVIAVDRTAGTITVNADVVGDWVATDTLNVVGDYNAKMSGLAAWLPSTAPSSTLFFGVDRSQDTTRLGGVRYDGSSETIEEALIGCAALLGREGGRPNMVFMNPIRLAELIKALGSKVVYSRVSSSDEARIGFDSVKVATPIGFMDVVGDPYCPLNVAYMLKMDTWKLYSLGEVPDIFEDDNTDWLRVSTDDAYEVRCGYYANLGCSAPGWNARIALA